MYGNWYDPELVVVVFQDWCVSLLTATTDALGIRAPLGSVTWPLSVPRNSCAGADSARHKSAVIERVIEIPRSLNAGFLKTSLVLPMDFLQGRTWTLVDVTRKPKGVRVRVSRQARMSRFAT